METLTCNVNQFVGSIPSGITCSLPADDPTWADIFSAWGTVGATAAAVIFGAVSLTLSLHERHVRSTKETEMAAQAHAEREAIIRSQAERVACWLEWQKIAPEEQRVSTGHTSLRLPNFKLRIVLQNASDQPIWEVGLSHWSLGDSKFTQVPVVAAGATRTFDVRPRPKEEGLTIEEAVDVRFRDNAGRNWYRPAHAPGTLQLEEEMATTESGLATADEQTSQ